VLEELKIIDPRVRESVQAELERHRARPDPLPPETQVVLVGHRMAGKSTLLPHIASRLDRPGFDLDVEIARRSGRSVKELFESGEAAFRRAERDAFLALPTRAVVASGGGFLAHHGELLKDRIAVLVPISEETYRERLRGDATRPRLRPHLSLDDELSEIFSERERLHAGAECWGLGRFLAALDSARAERGGSR
jgi:shikimate kinase